MIDFDHSISNNSSHESNNLNSDFIGSKRSEDSEEIFKDDEFEDSEAKKSDDEDGEWDAENGSKTNVELDLTDDSKRVLDSDVLQVYFQKMGSHTLLNAEQEKEVSKRIEDGVMEMKRVFCFSLPVQDYLGKLLLDLKNNKVRAVRLIAGLDEDDNLIEDENKAQKKLITSLDRYQKIAEQFRGFTSKTGKKEREKITKQLEKNLLKINFNSEQISAMYRSMQVRHQQILELQRQIDALSKKIDPVQIKQQPKFFSWRDTAIQKRWFNISKKIMQCFEENTLFLITTISNIYIFSVETLCPHPSLAVYCPPSNRPGLWLRMGSTVYQKWQNMVKLSKMPKPK